MRRAGRTLAFRSRSCSSPTGPSSSCPRAGRETLATGQPTSSPVVQRATGKSAWIGMCRARVVSGSNDLGLQAKVANGSLRVEVIDRGDGCPVPGRAQPYAEWGRGLSVVSALATNWGVVMEPDWKSVWFELRRPVSPSRRERRLLLGRG